MKAQEVKAILLLSTVSASLLLSACSKNEPVIEPVGIEAVSENTVSDNLVDDVNSTISGASVEEEVVDMTLDNSFEGTYFALEDISVYKDADTTSEVVGTLTKDAEVIIVGMDKETGMFKVQLENKGFGFADSSLFDTVLGGLQDADTITDSTETTDATLSTDGFTPEEIQAINDAIANGTGTGTSSSPDVQWAIDAGATVTSDGVEHGVPSPEWDTDFTGSTTGEVNIN